LESEEYYINAWLSQCKEVNGEWVSPAYESVPYSEGFGEDGNEKFSFIEGYNDKLIKSSKQSENRSKDETLWLISPKARGTINTQFKRVSTIGLNPLLGYKDGEKVKVSSEYGEFIFEVECSKDLRSDISLITGNTIGVNFLTPPVISKEGESACYQEVKVSIERV
jgi:hypothetical protein